LKYHPEEYNKRREEMRLALQKRCEVFSRLADTSRLMSVSLDVSQTNDIISFIDAGNAAVITGHF